MVASVGYIKEGCTDDGLEVQMVSWEVQLQEGSSL